jgi:DNA-binding winged helix-turn-helix (wHTH) protein
LIVNECKIPEQRDNTKGKNVTLKMYWKPLLMAAVLGSLLVASWAMTARDKEQGSFDAAKEHIALRKIGHEILLQSGDSLSRVPPVEQTGPGTYQLRLGTPVFFDPDSLVKTVDRVIRTASLSKDYVVNMISCSDQSVIFGYAIAADQQNNIIACKGRQQPKTCYILKIIFPVEKTVPRSYYAFLAGALGIGIAWAGWRKNKKDGVSPDPEMQTGEKPDLVKNQLAIGRFIFLPDQHLLLLEEQRIPLTGKETKVLCMLAQSPNQVVPREQLMKEGWEDEGVIVGRSLDMFVSKLRKKLQGDPSVQLLNLHGKGYKLAIESLS